MLKPVDVAVLLYLVIHARESFAHMGALLGISTSTAHESASRLERSGLVHRIAAGFSVARGPALEFLLFGVPYAFAPEILPRARGVLTGLAAPGASTEADAPEGRPMVWPSKLGNITGMGIKPLVKGAPDSVLREPRLYRMLALVDALRTGDAREREYARRAMRQAIEATSA